MNVEELNEHQLKDLQNKITHCLKDIEKNKKDQNEKKNFVQNKTKMCQLTKHDRMFCISISQGVLYAYDYCNVENYTIDNEYSKQHTFSIAHPKKPMGIYGASILKERAEEKGYYLTENCGNASFYTLYPQTWEVDLAESIKYAIKIKNENLKRDVVKFKKNVESILKKEESKKIYDFLNS